MLGDDDRIMKTITRLETERKELDAQLIKPANQLEVQRLKRRKLVLKDEISRLQSFLCPDIIA